MRNKKLWKGFSLALAVMTAVCAVPVGSAVSAMSAAEFTDGMAEQEVVVQEETAGSEAGTEAGAEADTDMDSTTVDVAEPTEADAFSDGTVEVAEAAEVGAGEAGDAEEVFIDSVEDCPAASITDAEKEKAVKAAIEDIIKETGITEKNTDLEKICMIMRWFRDHTRHNTEASYQSEAYAVLVNRMATCGGYAEGLQRLLSKVGIKGQVRIGPVSSTVSHAWVEVNIFKKWYVCDAVGAVSAGYFMENYENYHFNDKFYFDSSRYRECDGAYSVGNIRSGGVDNYLGAKGNTLYFNSGFSPNYYANDGTGWKVIKKEDVPSDLCGAKGTINKEVDHITYNNSSDIQLDTNAKIKMSFYITNKEAHAKAAELTCKSSNENIVSGTIVERNDNTGDIKVEITAKGYGKAKIIVSAPNNVKCEVPVEVKKQLPLKVTARGLFRGSEQIYGWAEDEDGYLYYADKTTGIPAQGFVTIDGKDYFFRPGFLTGYEVYSPIVSGCVFAVLRNTSVRINGQWYTFDKNGQYKKINYNPYEDPTPTVKPSAPKPAKPEVKGAPYKYSYVKLTWNKAKNADGYQVYRYNSSSKKYERIATLKGANTLSYSQKVGYGKTYSYKVRAYNKETGVATAYSSSSAAVKVKTAPYTPSISGIKAGSGYLSVTWKAAKTAEGYQVYRASSKTGTYTKVKTLSSKTLSYKNTGLSKGKTYYYKVRAYRTGADGKKVYGKFSPVVGKKTK